MLSVTIAAPVGATIFMRKFKAILNDEPFQQRFGTLYQRQRTNVKGNDVQLWFTPVFLSKRLILAATTVYLGMFPLSQISFYIGTALYSMCFVSSVRPFESKLLNRVNFLNECMLLLTSYFLLILTDIVPDLELRERIGWKYLYCLVTVVGLNFTIVFY